LAEREAEIGENVSWKGSRQIPQGKYGEAIGTSEDLSSIVIIQKKVCSEISLTFDNRLCLL
jgi:hypothetical protein